jgi:broad specificity phosphatase PhoE
LGKSRVLFLRHAETSEPDRFHGAESDVGLGERGRAQADAVARFLASFQPDALYCSGMRRAIETAEPIARACGLVLQVVLPLHERRLGPLSGQPRDALRAIDHLTRDRWMAGDLDFTQLGAESYNDVRRRAIPEFLALVERHPDQTIVVVAHGVVIRVVLTTLLDDLGPEDFDRIAIEHTAVNILRWEGSRWRADALSRAPDGSASSV